MYLEGINVGLVGLGSRANLVLDFGCGSGAITIFFVKKGFTVVGCDIDPACESLIQGKLECSERHRFQFMRLDAESESLPIFDKQFDLILCREVLEHIRGYQSVLRQFRAILKKDGMLVVSCPTWLTEKLFSFFDRQWLRKSEHINVFPKGRMIAELDRHLFEVKRVEGQSFKWSLFWLLLSPIKVNHRMGNPTSHPRFVKLALRIVNAVERMKVIDRLGNIVFPKSYFYYAKKRRPKILVIFDYEHWILGRWAKHIERIYGHEYDIRSISMFDIAKDRKAVEQVVRDADLIHLLLPHCFDDISAIGPRAPMVTTIHHWVNWDFVSRAAEKSHEIVTGAYEWKNRLVERGIPEDRITVVHSGVEKRFFGSEAPLIPPSEKITFGFFGKFDSNENDRKGTRHLRSVVDSIRESGYQESFRVIVSGPGWRDVIAYIEDQSIEVIYFEFTAEDDMPALYRSLDIYLMLSDVEGGPATVMEAMASKCLVLANNIGVVIDIVQDGVNGVIVQNTAYIDIVEKMMLLKKHDLLAHEIRQRGYDFAKEHLSYDKTLEPLGNVYEKYLS